MKKTAIAIRQPMPGDPTTLKELRGAGGGQNVVSTEAAELAHNRYHRAVRSSAAMAIVYAAMAGRELLECRKKIKHGGWEKWVEANCEFSLVTAWRYMETSNQLREKISNLSCTKDLEGKEKSRESLIKLLDRPPSELLPNETEQLLTDIRAATKGQTLRQLWFDFGLDTPPKPVGGANHLHGFLKQAYPDHLEYLTVPLKDLPKDVVKAWEKHLEDETRLPPGETMAHLTAKEFWERVLGEMHQDFSKFKRYAHLDIAELKDVSENLLDARRKIDELIKKG